MTEQEMALFLLKIITNPNMQMSVSEAKPISECQEWLTKLSEKKNG